MSRQGKASYYGNKFHGRRTSNQEVYDMYAFTAAHKTLPLPSFARVTNLDNGKSVVVRVNDRGPFHEGRVIDLSYAAAVKLVSLSAVWSGGSAGPRQPGVDDKPTLAPTPSTSPPPRTSRARSTRLVAAMPIASARAGELPPGMRIATGKPTPVAAVADRRWPRSRRRPQSPPPMSSEVDLQVASFSARDNADRALSTLRNAGIDARQLSDVNANGRTLWRLRVGPLQAARRRNLPPASPVSDSANRNVCVH